MDAKNCWIVSIAIHGVMLLGAAVMAFDHFVLGEGDGSGFSCRLGDPTPKFVAIERPKDQFGGRIPDSDRGAMAEVSAPPWTSGFDEPRRSECCACGCGGAATTIVVWPKDIMGYFDRKLSMATGRKGVPRLKTHSRLCAFQETGEEADCTCGLVPRGTDLSTRPARP